MNAPKREARGKVVITVTGNAAAQDLAGKSKYYAGTEPTIVDEFGQKPGNKKWGSTAPYKKKWG